QALDRWGGTAVGSDAARDVPVMKMDGVVDALGQMTLSSRLQKVIWEKQRLTVWLAVSSAKLQDRPYEDIYRIAHRFLVGVPEYREVEVRVVTKERPDVVQFSVVATTRDMVDAPRPDTPAAHTFVQNKLNVVETR
ncbi:MAG: hypothetical protein WCC10_11830, partial [Tumebacillaceae bacterium]